jgi:hypothetical protein
MKKEVITEGELAGLVSYTKLFQEGEWSWNIMIRAGGSISLYATTPGFGGHAVVYDTLDNKPPNETAVRVIKTLSEMAEGTNALLAILKERNHL